MKERTREKEQKDAWGQDTYCSSCGNAVDPSRNFCSSCGEKIQQGGTPRNTATFEQGQHAGRSGDTTMGAITHVLALVSWVIGPAIVLIATNDRFVKENARNALNWQIMFTVYFISSTVLIFAGIGLLLVPLVALLDLVFCIIAAIKASEGEIWSYPATIDIV